MTAIPYSFTYSCHKSSNGLNEQESQYQSGTLIKSSTQDLVHSSQNTSSQKDHQPNNAIMEVDDTMKLDDVMNIDDDTNVTKNGLDIKEETTTANKDNPDGKKTKIVDAEMGKDEKIISKHEKEQESTECQSMAVDVDNAQEIKEEHAIPENMDSGKQHTDSAVELAADKEKDTGMSSAPRLDKETDDLHLLNIKQEVRSQS